MFKMKDSIPLIHSYNSLNFIKNLKEKINNQNNTSINKEYLAIIGKSYLNNDTLDDIVVALLNFIWPSDQERVKNYTLKKFIKHVLKSSNATISIYISAIYYLLNLKDNNRYNNLLQRIQLEIENTKQEQGFINNSNLHERCCASCGAYISCYRSETTVCKCRLFLTSLILASKFGQDKNYSNKAWSKISRFSVENINYNERFFLNLIDYKLFINIESYRTFATLISNHIVSIENQRKKLKYQELLNISNMHNINVSNAQEWKKYLEKKSALTKKLRQLEAMKQAKIKIVKSHSLQNEINATSMFSNTSSSSVQKLSPYETNYIPNISTEVKNTNLNIHKLSPVDNQVGVYLKTEIVNKQDINQKPANLAAISPISPSDLPCASINANNNAEVNNIPNYKQLPVFNVHSVQEPKEEKTYSDKLTVESFSSFVNFYSCINNKFSTCSETVIKSTDSYKILEFALSLVLKRRTQDALSILNHIIYGNVDICKEILSLALKGHVKTALIYIYLLTPNEINYYNTHIKSPSLKLLSPEDVLSIVSKLLNCVQKSTKPTEIKNDLLGNLGGQNNQVQIPSNQNVLLKFIQNINCSLSHS